MPNAIRDENYKTAILGVSSVDLTTPTRIAANPTTGALLIDGASLYSGLDARYLKLNATATQVSNTPAGNISGITIQSALNELDSEKVKKVTATDNAVTRFDGTTGEVQNSGIYISDTAKIGNIATPIHDVDVNTGSIRAGSRVFWTKSVIASNTTWTELTNPAGGALSQTSFYKIQLFTTGTSVDTGAFYILRRDEDTDTWVTRMVSQVLQSSNRADIVIDGGVVKIRTYHPDNYTIKVYVEEWETSEKGFLNQFAGADSIWQRLDTFTYYTDGNVGIGTSTPIKTLDVTGTVRSTGVISSTVGGQLGAGEQPLTSPLYVQSRGQNLITNGSGLLLNDYNFSSYDFDSSDTHGGGGSFKSAAAHGTFFNDELIPVDIERHYTLSMWIKSGNTDGSSYDANNKQYLGVVPYDIDGNVISPQHYHRVVGSTDTTLAVALNPGDTTMTLTDATGWSVSATDHLRQFCWFGYTNAKGYTYPDYTYTRNMSQTYYPTLGTWTTSGKSGNVITFRLPWLGPALPAGTKVRNNQNGANYKYLAMGGTLATQTWSRKEGWIGGIDTTGVGSTNLFPYGTAYIKLLHLCNYLNFGINNTVRISDIVFQEIPLTNYPNFNIGNKDIDLQVRGVTDNNLIKTDASTDSVGIGTATPNSKLDIRGNTHIQQNLYVNGVAGSTTNSIRLHHNGSGGYVDYTTGGVRFRPSGTGSNNVMITDSGDVGIGTTTPNSKLDVGGTVQADGLRLDVTPTAEAIVPTHTITISVNGTNYKIPIVAA